MAKCCCICGRKLGIFGEERYKLAEEYIACYSCAQIFRKLKEFDDKKIIDKYEKELLGRLDENNASQEVRNLVENEIENIKRVKYEAEKKKELEKQRKEQSIRKRNEFMVTTGYNFEGYTIKKYLNLVHGENVLGTGMFSEASASIADIFGTSSEEFGKKISKAKEDAQEKMIINALMLGANAIIGIDFDITTFSNNIIGVSTNGTAVIIDTNVCPNCVKKVLENESFCTSYGTKIEKETK